MRPNAVVAFLDLQISPRAWKIQSRGISGRIWNDLSTKRSLGRRGFGSGGRDLAFIPLSRCCARDSLLVEVHRIKDPLRERSSAFDAGGEDGRSWSCASYHSDASSSLLAADPDVDTPYHSNARLDRGREVVEPATCVIERLNDGGKPVLKKHHMHVLVDLTALVQNVGRVKLDNLS